MFVKIPMGLERFEVRFFFAQHLPNSTKHLSDYLKLLKTYSALVHNVLTFWQEKFSVVKSIMGIPVDSKILTLKKLSSFPKLRKVSNNKSASERLKKWMDDYKKLLQIHWKSGNQ